MKQRAFRFAVVYPLGSGDFVIVLPKPRGRKIIIADQRSHPTPKRVDACLAA